MVDVLTVEPGEGVEQIQARLARVRSRHVCLYIPKANRALRHRLPWTLLRRTADDLGLNLTIVARDSATRMMAGHAGFRVRRRLEPIRKSRPGQDVRRASSASFSLGSPASAVALAVVLLLLGFAAAGLVLPHATIVVTPRTVSLDTAVDILADPALTVVDVAEHRIPARRLEVTLEREAREPTSARKDVPDAPARGTVVFVNQSEREVVIPVGSIITSDAGTGVPFRTLERITLPAPAGAKARVRVEAVEPGIEGNVPAYTLSVLDPGLGLPVAVVNDRPMSGGTVRRVGVVTQAERDRVRDTLYQRSREEALRQLTAQLGDGETLIDDSIDIQVVEESFAEQVEAVADVITVRLTLRARGTAVRLDQAHQLAGEVLRQQVPAGQVVVADSLTTTLGPIQGTGDGHVRLHATASAVVRPYISESDIRNVVRGRPVDEAAILLLERFPMTAPPIIHLSRGWLGRLPWLPVRIDVIVGDDTTIIG